MSVHFEERSGAVLCQTPWGSWYQTMEEVFIEVNVPPGTSSKDIKCSLGSRNIELMVKGKEIFKERSGAVLCQTPWGSWYQTMEEVFIEVNVPPGTSSKDIKCSLGSRNIELMVKGKEIFKGKLFGSTVGDEATWTLEDKKLIRIILMKTNRDAGNCWTSLLEEQYAADPWLQDQMQKKLTLERFQRENPGFDFSGAEISGNFHGGGPDFSGLQK